MEKGNTEGYIMSSTLCAPRQIFLFGDQIKKSKMEFSGEHLEDLGVDGKIILDWIFEKWDRERGLH